MTDAGRDLFHVQPTDVTAPVTTPSARSAPFITVFAAITVLTWWTGTDALRFTDAAPIAFEGGFPGEPDNWTFSGRRGEIRLDETTLRFDGSKEPPDDARAGSAYRTVDLASTNATGQQFLGVQGSVSVERKPSVRAAARSAALLVWFKDERGEPFDYHTIGLLRDVRGDGGTFARTVAVPERARQLVVALVGRHSDGSFTLREWSVDRFELAKFYPPLRVALFLSWLVLVVVALRWAYRRSPGLLASSVSLPLALTFVGVLAPENMQGPVLAIVERQLAALLDRSSLTPAELLFKGGHFLAFLVLSFPLFAFKRRIRLSMPSIAAVLVLLAVGTEGLQLHLADRTTRTSDIAVDVAAILCALLLTLLIDLGRRLPKGLS